MKCTISYRGKLIIPEVSGKRYFPYVYKVIGMFKKGVYTLVLLFLSQVVSGQEIKLQHKLKPDKSKTLRLDKPVMVRTFDGIKLDGMLILSESGNIILEGKEISPGDIMTISALVRPNSREKAVGLGLTIGAGVVLPLALYYFLGGIAWGMPNGIFVGSTILVFDLMLAYAGTTLMGIFPRRFSTMNWEVVISPADSDQEIPELQPYPVPLPRPSG
jgi:hypothetical protein